ncbi:ribonuclease H-like domain-containing protein [Tanacetum coccineum]|uniref:Ribonuclease H-like domain-containing protein n=1 Tax=Tanacetum coccineum TaxID=301880 RepID=A0ABQ4WL71_9ASTR
MEVHGAPISKEDINHKFLRSLPHSWNQIALIMRNKPDIDEIDIADLYNNLRVYEDEIKRSSSFTSTSQNLAFLSSENTSSTNKVSTTSGYFGVSTARGISQVSSTPCAHDVASGRNQGKRSYGNNGRSNAPTNESSSQALVAQDGLGGYEWSNDFEVEPVNYALMAISSSSSSSSSDNEVQKCSKQCLESFKTLQKNYDSEREKHSRARLEIQGYELALESLESMILVHEKNKLAWGEKYENIFVAFESTPDNDRSSTANGYHDVPPPITGNFLTPRADISFTGLDEYAIRKKIIESKTTDLNTKTSETIDDEDDVSEVQIVSPVKTNESQTVKPRVDKIGQTFQKQGIGFKKIKACFVYKSTNHLIKDYNFHDKKSQEPKLKNVVNTGPRVNKLVWDNAKRQNEKRAVHKVSTARPVSTTRPVRPVCTVRPGNPGSCYKDHLQWWIVVCLAIRLEKAYLSDYEDFNGGFVAFGSDPKGGKITGKGKIKTANLDFDDVYFVDELKFNLFFVSQMCDKKNSVLFTKSECLILSPSFKLLMESQVVLRAPRKDEYSLDLKNIVPFGGITCLYANATADESTLWHRRLGHVNFKNINKLVKGYLVRGLPSKVFVNDHTCVACKKGKQHKASLAAKAMDDVSRQAFEEEKRRIASQKKATQATSTNKLSTNRQSVSTDRPFVSTDRPSVSIASTPTGTNAGESSFVYLGGKIPIDASTLPNVDLPIDLNMPNLEDASDTLPNDGIFNYKAL